MGVLTQVEVQRIIGLILVGLVYFAVFITWRRHGTRYVFLGYTSILVGTAMSLLFAAYTPELTIIRDIAIVIVLIGGTTFFFLSAYKTNKRLEQLTNGDADDE